MRWADRKTSSLIAGMFDDVIVKPIMTKAEALATARRHNGHAYRLFEGPADYATAKAACTNLGGHLITITSAEEDKVVRDILSPSRQRCWIGLESPGREHAWVTGEALTYNRWHKSRKGRNNRDPVHVTVDGDWWCTPANQMRWFICEWDDAPE
jgi:hypothetical protein